MGNLKTKRKWPLNVRLEDDVARDVRRLAKAQVRTFQAQVNLLLRIGLRAK